ncbi:MAG: hypothetical protein B7Z66_02680 [Chromatiales bacterium 21-64-14]|nr:MAG: hypothetical protein B7Z66_02680 [Chromatiales bacterium 21-64-14]HQU14528.1 DUF6502 family protein [Gammaproteobacteria bacterium]
MLEATLKSALVELLRPLVRYLIRQGWGYPALCELLKPLYVGEAEAEHGAGTRGRLTDSHLSLLTGIHRKEIKRLKDELAEDGGASAPRRGVNVAARVVGTWVSDPDYLDAAGEPRPVPLRDPRGGPSFEALVRSVKADLRARSVLDELLRVGVAEEAPGGQIRLLRTAYVSPVAEEKLEFLAANVGDHLRSALHNLSTPQAPYLERALYHDAIPADELERLRPELMRLADPLLRQANQRLMSANTVGTESGSRPRRRMRLGVYYYEEDTGGDPLDSD